MKLSGVQAGKSRRWEVFSFFTRLGLIGFGGPQAHIALMQEQAQEERNWLTKEEFSEALAVCNILPGPASTQLATYLGWWRGGGVWGGLAAAVGFIWPSFVLMLSLSWLYFTYGALPQINAFFYGLKPVVVAIVLATAWRLAKPARGDWRFWLIVTISAVLIGGQFFNDFLVFLGAALLGLLLYWKDRPTAGKSAGPKAPERGKNPPLEIEPASPDDPASVSRPPSAPAWAGLMMVQAGGADFFSSYATDLGRLAQLGWFFLRAGAFIFGGGLVIIPLIQNEIVNGYGWLTTQQFLDGAALGQATPGPVLITGAFVGYATAGLVGAFVATVCIFLPGLTLILLAAPVLQRVRQFPPAKPALAGVNGAVVGSLLAGAYLVGQTAFFVPGAWLGIGLGGKTLDLITVGLAVVALILNLKYKLNTIYLFLGAGLLGLLLKFGG